jgi:5'-nucleotidase
MPVPMETPLILLTNDDGHASPFLRAIAQIMRDRLSAEVLIVAPERQRSAMSHSITLHKPLRVIEQEPNVFSVSGSPVDCVYLGLLKLASRRPALVVSGPNDGLNLGTDVFYSGTVGAAVEGGLRGVPSIAVSVDRGQDVDVPMAGKLVCSLATAMWKEPLPAGTVLNVNVPKNCDGKAAWTRLGKRHYEDDVHQRTDPRGQHYYWIGGGIAGISEIPGSDCTAVVKRKVASITPLHLNLTSHGLLGDDQPSWSLGDFEVV